MRLLSFFAILLIAGCTSRHPVDEPAPIRGDSGVPNAIWPRPYFNEYDAVATAAGLVPLRHDTLNPGREVRIWIGGGLGYPQQLYRFVERGRRVDGEVVHYWPTRGLPDERPGEGIHDLMLYSQAGRCDRFARTDVIGICRALFVRTPDWRDVLRRAEGAGLWELPDPSTLPPDGGITLDGWGITVELRDAAFYRAYHYSNPHLRPWPEARRAEEIARVVHGLDSLERTPDVIRNHRGVTTGRYDSEFRPCEGGGPWLFHADLRSVAGQSGVTVPGDSADATALFYVEVVAQLTPEWIARYWNSPYTRVLQVNRVVDVKPWTGTECAG